jgi:hypothetical protein
MNDLIGSGPGNLLPVHVSRPTGQPDAALLSAAAQHSTAQHGMSHHGTAQQRKHLPS